MQKVPLANQGNANAWFNLGVMYEAVERDSNPVPSQEAGLLDLLRKAEGYAYALAHGYDIGGQQAEPMGS